jgi:hypothetical protein
MSERPNQRFAEYTTSGAFSLGLTRHQVSALAMAEGGAPRFPGAAEASLERKGLIEPLLAPDHIQHDREEFRPTLAGLLTISLLRQAGLINGGSDPVAAEFETLRAELVRLRVENGELMRVARSAMARKQRAEQAFAAANAIRKGRKIPIRIAMVRDPLPHASDAEILARAADDRGAAGDG